MNPTEKSSQHKFPPEHGVWVPVGQKKFSKSRARDLRLILLNPFGVSLQLYEQNLNHEDPLGCVLGFHPEALNTFNEHYTRSCEVAVQTPQ